MLPTQTTSSQQILGNLVVLGGGLQIPFSGIESCSCHDDPGIFSLKLLKRLRLSQTFYQAGISRDIERHRNFM